MKIPAICVLILFCLVIISVGLLPVEQHFLTTFQAFHSILPSYLDLRVRRDEADVETVSCVVVPEHGREDLEAIV